MPCCIDDVYVNVNASLRKRQAARGAPPQKIYSTVCNLSPPQALQQVAGGFSRRLFPMTTHSSPAPTGGAFFLGRPGRQVVIPAGSIPPATPCQSDQGADHEQHEED